MIGPVHEKETNTSVSAMKKIPIKLVAPALLSALFDQELGSVISNAPRKEIPKIKNIRKKTKLATQLVARLFKAVGPKITVIKKPSNVKINIMEVAYKNAFFTPS